MAFESIPISTDQIIQRVSLIVGLLGSGGLVGLLVWLWKGGKFFGRLEEQMKVLPKLDARSQRLETHLSQVTNSIVEIQTLLGGRGFTISQRLVITSASPTRLTEYGEQMMQDTGLYRIVEDNKGFLIDLIKGRNPKTNYDIQEFSFAVLKELAVNNNQIIFPLKNYAYQKGLVLDIVLQAAGIVLRDTVMQELKFEDQTLDQKT